MLSIFFTGSVRDYKRMRPVYANIIEIIKKLGAQLTWNVVESVDYLLRHNITELPVSHWQKLYKQLLRALQNSDLVILENSVSAFSTGYLTGVAISQKIPTLVLKQKQVKHTFKTSFLDGIQSPYLTSVKYNTLDDIYKAIKEFIQVNTSNVPKSFHLKLSPKEKRFVEKMAQQFGISKIRYIRKLINDAMIDSEL